MIKETKIEISIYFYNIKNVNIDDIISKYKNYIKEDDIKKMKEFKPDLNKKQSIVSSILKNKYVKDDIYYNEQGKPLSNSIFFNISHSDDYVVIALCNTNNVGIDIEHIKDKVSEDIINYVCNEEEIDYISRNDKNKTFYYLWTRKEALLKCKGIGLSTNLKNVLKDNNYYLETRYIDDYVYSIALDCDKSEIVELHIDNI